MNPSESQLTTLTPPEELTTIAANQAPELVPLVSDTQQRVDSQVNDFVNQLLDLDMHSETFRNKLDAAFKLGREEIANVAQLSSGRFMEQNMVGIENSPAFKSMQSMRELLDELNPGKAGDLLQSNKILGLIPYGNKLQRYFRKFASAQSQLQTIMTQIYAARDDMQRDANSIEQTKIKFWAEMQKLKAAIYFAEQLDQKLTTTLTELKVSDPLRAKALEQEVLFYARQNLTDMQTQLAVTVNGYLAMDILKKTVREMINGCNRVATTGMSALAIAQTVARATGNQLQVMDMLTGVSSTIGDLVTETSQQISQHVDKTKEFSSNPLIGIQKIQEMFDNSFKAIDAMDNFRSQALVTMAKNNQILQTQIQRAEQYLDRTRAEQAKAAISAIDDTPGPVKL